MPARRVLHIVKQICDALAAEGYEILAAGDPQIRRALETFDEAKDLLARRQALGRTPPSDSSDASGASGIAN